MKLTHTVDIAAPPSVVWDVWTDLERWPEWTASMSSIERLAPGPLAVGLRVRIEQPKLPSSELTVMEVTPRRTFSWGASRPGTRVTASHAIEPLGNGSRATLAVSFEGWLGALIGRMIRARSEQYLKLEGSGLKARSEERARVWR